jgi:hypothetical protein
MKRRPKFAIPEEIPLAPAADATAILQIKVWFSLRANKYKLAQ